MGLFNKKNQDITLLAEVEDNREADRQILATLLENGDDASATRESRHYGYFKCKKQYKQFMQFLTEQKTPFKKIAKLGVIIYGESTMQEKDIFALIDSIASLFRTVGGEYDGWETRIIEKQPQ